MVCGREEIEVYCRKKSLMKYTEMEGPAFAKLSQLRSGALFMKMGEKKIKLAFDLIKSKINEVDYIVWIAPNAFLNSKIYKERIEENSVGFRSKMYFFSVECVSVSDIRYLQLHNLVEKYKVFCVIDDSLTIKNTEAGRTKRLLSIAAKFEYRLILSSLPLTQGLVDLYSQLQFMNPKLLNMTEAQFFNNFLPYYEDEFKTVKRWSRPEDEKLLVEKMLPYIYDSDLDFNDKIKYFNVYFDLTPKEQESYMEEKNDFLNNKSQVPFMEVVQKFQRIYTIAKNKVEGLFELVSEIKLRREKVIIYVKFLDEIKFFKECGWFEKGNFVVLTGKSNKRKAIQLFETDVDVMFSSYGVDSLGLDLKICQNVIFFSQTFDYRVKLNLLHNIEYSEANQEIKIYNFWMKTGLDEMIRKNLLMKQDVLTNVCNIISKEEALKL